MKKKKYLPLYCKFLKEGCLPSGYGLCWEFTCAQSNELKEFFSPPYDIEEKFSHMHWGSGHFRQRKLGIFTPLRQNIVLFLAAMNNEL